MSLKTSALLTLHILFGSVVFAQPVLTFEPQAVVAQVRPGTTTAWFGVASRSGAYTQRTFEYARILDDDDRDGVIRYELDAPAPIAVWMVVDMSNGQHTISAPSGTFLKHKVLPPGALKHQVNGEPAALVVDQNALSVCWVVRPGAGAWRMMLDEGADDDSTHGSVTARIHRLHGIGESPVAPDDFRPGDIVVTVALDTLVVSEVRAQGQP